MTKLEVMALEESAPLEFGGDKIIYGVEVWERKVHLVYDFINNTLINAKYMIITRPGKEYLDYRKTIELKYGKPTVVTDDDRGNYRFTWKTEATTVVMKPGRDRELLIEYTGKKYKDLRSRLGLSKRNKVLREIKSTF